MPHPVQLISVMTPHLCKSGHIHHFVKKRLCTENCPCVCDGVSLLGCPQDKHCWGPPLPLACTKNVTLHCFMHGVELQHFHPALWKCDFHAHNHSLGISMTTFGQPVSSNFASKNTRLSHRLKKEMQQDITWHILFPQMSLSILQLCDLDACFRMSDIIASDLQQKNQCALTDADIVQEVSACGR